MKYIIGIGNPNKQYWGTRHNVGFAAIDAMNAKIDKASTVKWNEKESLEAFVSRPNDKVTLLKPQLYVNNTGGAVTAVVGDNPVKNDLLFICDDVRLVFGKLRLRASGSSGGHKGLQSVIDKLGSEEFPRLRIGVGNETMPKEDLTPFVLGKFNSQEVKELPRILDKVVSVCVAWLERGLDHALNELSKQQSLKQE